MPQLKVCGITDAAFALEAARRGIDYLGFIFAAGSPRRVDAARAREIAQNVRHETGVDAPRFVGVFVEQDVPEILQIAKAVPLDVVQLHGAYGSEKVAAIKAQGYEVWRLAGDGQDCAGEDATLLDGRDGARSGGTGRLADWSRIADLKRAGRRVVLAGGISAANAAAAATSGADIVDVNSSLETAPGVKSTALLHAFLAEFPPR